MDASAARELAHFSLISSIDIAVIALALMISCASLAIVLGSLRRLRHVAQSLERTHARIASAAAPAVPQSQSDLQRALAASEFELLFQPQGSFGTLEVTLVEALLRWRLPDGSFSSPCEFLPAAEQSGLITEIDDWVLKCAIETAAGWHRGCWPAVRMAVNVSPRQLLDDSFVDRVSDLLRESRLPPGCLEIEVTENVLQTTSPIIDSLERLRALGVSIALDDFGTGYSSLTSLEQLPLTRVKIDRSLIGVVDTSARSATIVRAIMTLCHSLGLQVTVEGVERASQIASLLSNSEVDVQGYLLARPLGAAEFELFLRRSHEHMQKLLLQSFEHLQGTHSDALRFTRPLRVNEGTP